MSQAIGYDAERSSDLDFDARRRQAIAELRRVGAECHARGWSFGTSSNYSILLSRDPYRLLITASGKDKGRLGDHDFVVVDERGRVVGALDDHAKPSAETHLHIVATHEAGIGAVLHTHSVWGTLLSDRYFADGGFSIEGYEMLKGFDGITTHESRKWIEIFDNTQDIRSLSERVAIRMHDSQNPLHHGYLIRRHGLYTWGRDLAEARRHLEVFEFLFEVTARTRLSSAAV